MFTFLSNLSKANMLAESSINPFSSEYRKKKESLQEAMQQKMRQTYGALPKNVRDFGGNMQSAFAPIAKIGNTAVDTIKRSAEYENRIRPIREYLNNSFNEYGLNYNMIQRASPEVRDQFMSVMNQVGVEVPGYAEFMEQKRKQEEWDQKNFFQKTGETILNGVGGVMEQAPQVTANVLNFVGKAQAYANPVSYVEGLIKGKDVGTLYDEKIGNDIKNVAEGASNFVRKYGAYDPESTAAQVGKFGMDLGASLVGPNKLAPFAGASKLAKAGNIAAEGALIGGKFDVASKGEVTSDGLLYGAGGNLALAGAFKAGGTIKNSMTKKLPAKLTLNGLINPGKLDAVKKSLQIDEGVASPEDVGKWLINRIKPGDKESIAKQLLEHSDQSKQAVDDILAKIPERVQNKSAEKALSQLIDDYARTPGNEAKADMLSGLLVNGQRNAGYTLSEMNQIKRELDQAYNMFKGSGDATAGLRAEGIRNIRADIRKTIEDVASKYGEDIRKLNNETAVARGLAEGIMKKDNADAVRELLSPFSGMATGGVIAGVGSIANGQDPATVMKNILIGGIVGKAAASTTLKTSLAKALNSLGKKEMSALETYLKSQAEKGVKAGMKGSAGKTGGYGGVNAATNSLISAGKKVAKEVLRQAKVPAFTPLKPSKKLLDGKTPLKPSKPLSDGKTPLKPSKKLLAKGESHTKSPRKKLLTSKTTSESKPSSTNIRLEDTKQVQNLYKEYTKKHTKQSTLIIDSDNVKKLFSDFDPKAPEKVHEISSKVTQRFFETSLKDPKIKNVTFTMGGGGSGKSELIVQGAIERGDGLVLDGTGKSYKKLVANIEQAKKAGKKVKIEAVFIDFDKASAFNKKRDRTVPESILRETHKGYRESLVRLLKEYPDLDVSLTVNTGKRDVNGRAIGFPVPHERIIKFMLLQKDL